MKARNMIIMRRGYAPAKDIADATGKVLSTIHRLAEANKFVFVRDGRALYVRLDSVEAYFRREGLGMLADAVKKVAAGVQKEAAEAEKA